MSSQILNYEFCCTILRGFPFFSQFCHFDTKWKNIKYYLNLHEFLFVFNADALNFSEFYELLKDYCEGGKGQKVFLNISANFYRTA
jgi:hypothetical protein